MRWVLLVGLAAALTVSCGGDDPSGLGSGRRSSSSSGDTSSSGSSGDTSSSSGASSSGASSSGASGATGSTPADLCVNVINDYRKTNNLAPLERWTDGEACADGQSKSDSETRKAHGAFGQCGERGQNECPGWKGPPETMIPGCLKAMWNEGPGGGHHDLMATTKHTKVACGFYTTPQGAVWSVQNFR
jgi:hypothetical protein